MKNLKFQFSQMTNSKGELIKLVDRHRKIINCCEFLRKIYFPMLLAHYVLTAIGITFVGFQIIMVKFQIDIN